MKNTIETVQSRQFLPTVVETLPTPVYLHYFDIAAGTETLPHQHDWGQLHLIQFGVLEMEVAGRKMVSPSHYAIWTPPHSEHRAYNRKDIEYCAINVCANLTSEFPKQACMIALSPLVQSIINDLTERRVGVIESHQDQCLVDVLMERLTTANTIDRYLPVSSERLLQPIIQALEENPANDRPLSYWATIVHSTERTLSRRFRSELKMSFNEWRQRLKLMHSLQLLRDQHSINEVAFSLGYSQASSFIKMFRRQTGMTPESYRQQLLG